jgi:TPR repeat protein
MPLLRLLCALWLSLSVAQAAAPPDPLVPALVLDFQQDGVIADAATRARLYAEACAQGRSLACQPERWRPAEVLDRPRVREIFTPACTEGDPAACLVLGWLDTQIEMGMASPRAPDPARGAAHFDKACAAKLDRACAELGQLRLRGIGIERDLAIGRGLLDRACTAGIGNACSSLGWLQLEEEPGPADPAGAVRTFIRGCNRQDAISCLNAAELVGRGLDGPADPARIEDLLNRSCQAGLATACEELADQAPEEGRAARQAQLVRLTEEGCAGGDDRACANLGRRLLDGVGLPADRGRGLRLLRRSCEDGVLGACVNLSDALMDEPSPDRALVRALLTRACDDEQAAACARLGAMDLGPPDTTPTGVANIDKACALGLDSACVERGWLYLSEMAGPRDPGAAFDLWGRTCERRPGDACDALAQARLAGLAGSEPNPPLAAALFARGCEGGSSAACVGLGQLHQRGVVVDRDPSAAARLFTTACSAGNDFGCVNLAWALEEGFGLDRDLGTATSVYAKACADGLPKGCAHLAILEVRGYQVSLPAPSREVLKQACLDRSAAGCAGSGYLSVTGADGGAVDVPLGLQLLEQSCSISGALRCSWGACEVESAMACRWLSDLHRAGEFVPKDRRKARAYAEAACRAGDQASCAD